MAHNTRRLIVDHVRRHYADRNPRDIRISADGAVNVTLDRMPNTDRPGRVFAGWDADLLAEARAIAEQGRVYRERT